MTTQDIRSHNYWTKAFDDLYKRYGGICAYSAYYLQSLEVDHYLPISYLVDQHIPHLAYDWDNFRLASHEMNREKGDSVNVIYDPFEIRPGMFVIDFNTLSLRIKCGEDVTEDERQKVEATILQLKWNIKYRYRHYRFTLVDRYCRGCLKRPDSMASRFDSLRETAPFIAAELKRQKLKTEIIHRWKSLPQEEKI